MPSAHCSRWSSSTIRRQCAPFLIGSHSPVLHPKCLRPRARQRFRLNRASTRCSRWSPARRPRRFATLTGREAFLADHFPRKPVLPLSLLLESLLQLGGKLLDDGGPPFAPTGARKVKMNRFVEPGRRSVGHAQGGRTGCRFRARQVSLRDEWRPRLCRPGSYSRSTGEQIDEGAAIGCRHRRRDGDAFGQRRLLRPGTPSSRANPGCARSLTSTRRDFPRGSLQRSRISRPKNHRRGPQVCSSTQLPFLSLPWLRPRKRFGMPASGPLRPMRSGGAWCRAAE